MSLLIGLKKVEESDSFQGVDGLEGVSVSATKFEILKEGSRTEIKNFVKKARKNALDSNKEIKKLESEIDSDEDMPDKEYRRICNKIDALSNNSKILDYNKLIIIDGETI